MISFLFDYLIDSHMVVDGFLIRLHIISEGMDLFQMVHNFKPLHVLKCSVFRRFPFLSYHVIPMN